MPIDSDTFRTVMRQVAQPVTVVTVRDASGFHGMTASSFTSIATEPPLVLISVGESNATCGRIEAVGTFAVNVLGAGQHSIGEDFARPGAVKSSVFERIPHRFAVTGSPIFEDSVCWLDCSIFAKHVAGNCVLFIGRVEAAGVGSEQLPLLYRNRRYEQHSPGGQDALESP